MTLADTIPIADDRWSPVLAGVGADMLDCLQANLAAIADRHHPGAYLALGARLGFTLDRDHGARPVIAGRLDDRLAEAAELLGLRATGRWDGVDAAALRDLAAGHAPLYVVADAYSMSWLPYAGHRHLDHSFLLVHAGARAVIADAYHNNTEWGEARPGVWQIPAAELDAAATAATALTFDPGPPPRLDADAILAGNAVALAAAGPDIDAYGDAARASLADQDGLAQLVLDVWLLTRSRQLHAAWLASLGDRAPGAAAAREHAQAWQRFSTLAFVAERRARRGQAAAPALVDQLDALLREDVRLARLLAGPAEPRAVVLEELTAITGLDLTAPDPDAELRSLPGFNSFRLLDLIERAERRLGLQLDPDELTGDSLRTIASLCELFTRAGRRRQVGP
jgi:acyl carrier protein